MAEVEQFDRFQFAEALPKMKVKKTNELRPMFECIGIDKNELCWVMYLGKGRQPEPSIQNSRLRILVRSSINARTGIADGTGQNSIRLIVQRYRNSNWYSISKGPDAHTQRTPGWQKRLIEKVKELYKIWNEIPQTFTDDDGLFVSRQPNSKGRIFMKNEKTGDFKWLC